MDRREAESLGGRLPLLAVADLTPAQQETYARMERIVVPWAQKGGFESTSGDGSLIGPFNAFLYSPEITNAYVGLMQAEWAHTTLSARVREVIILTVGATWQCSYEMYAHTAVGKSMGLDEATISSILKGDELVGLTPEETIVHRVVVHMCTHHRIDQPLYEEAAHVFDPVALVNILQLTGMYFYIAALLNGFEVPTPAQ